MDTRRIMDASSNNKMYIKHKETSQNMIQLRQLQEDFIILEKNIKVWENQLTNILIRNFPIRCIDTYMNYNQKKENK